MNIPGVITVTPEQTALLDRAISMMGESFTEEPWTSQYLKRVAESEDQARAISDAMIRGRAELGAHHGQVYVLDDETACLLAYRKSEQDLDNDYFEELSLKRVKELPFMDAEMRERMEQAEEDLAPVSDFSAWHSEFVDGDYIHLVDLAVDKNARGRGSASKLMRAFFDYADSNGLSCVGECFSDELLEMYEHLGFEQVAKREGDDLPIYERCIVRWPK